MQRPDKYPTACPGDVGHTQFPWFRSYVKDKLDDAPEKTPVGGTSDADTITDKRYIFTGSGRSANSTVSTLAWDNKTSTYWETTGKFDPVVCANLLRPGIPEEGLQGSLAIPEEWLGGLVHNRVVQ